MKTNTSHASVLLVMGIQRKVTAFLPDPIPLLRNIGKSIAAAWWQKALENNYPLKYQLPITRSRVNAGYNRRNFYGESSGS